VSASSFDLFFLGRNFEANWRAGGSKGDRKQVLE